MDKDLPDPILTELIRHARKAVTTGLALHEDTERINTLTPRARRARRRRTA